jgi:ACS family hexuronate transporter-like MFS transporter
VKWHRAVGVRTRSPKLTRALSRARRQRTLDGPKMTAGLASTAIDLPGGDGRLGRHRWLVCALLFFATTVNYVDRQILSLCKPILDGELGWTNEQFGQVNAAFQAAYAVGLLVFGAFVDRAGTKLGYAVSIALWSLAALGHALVRGVGGFVGARVALGFGEGGNFPSAIKTVALWFPRRERAYATALFNSGANVGAIVAPAVVPWLALSFGWRAAFVAAGLAGLAWLLFWLPIFETPERTRRLGGAERALILADAETASPEARAVRWRALLARRQTWAFIVAKLLTDPVWWFFLIWLPDYFKKTRGLSIKDSWPHLVTIYGIVTVLSVAGGWLSGRLGRRKVALAIFACGALPVILLAVGHAGTTAAVVVVGVAGASHQAWSANLFTSVSDMFPKRAVASVVGLGGMAGSLGGIAFPIYAGRLLDRLGAAGYAVLFAMCGTAYLVAFALHHLLAPKFDPVETLP